MSLFNAGLRRNRAQRVTPVAALLIALFAGCQPSASPTGGSAFRDIKRSREIVAGWAPYAPYASVNIETKEPQGYYIDLFELMAKEADLKVKWVETTWSTQIADLKVGKFQVMAAPVYRTIPRAKEVAFTKAIDYFGLSAIVRVDDDRFQNPLDFNRDDVILAVTQGEVGHEFAQQHLPKVKLQVHKSGDIALALVDVIEGRADAGICDSWTAKQFAESHNTVVKDLFADRPFNRVGAGWFVSPEEGELLLFLNTSIEWLQSSGAAEQAAHAYQLPSLGTKPTE